MAGDTPKVGRKPGSQDEASVDAEGEADGETNSSPVPELVAEGLALMGRSGWSDGVAVATSAGTVCPGGGVTVVGGTVVVEITSWSSSSSSVGKGRGLASLGSMDSPQSLRWKSVQVPLFSLTLVSFTMTVHLPRPDSPLCKKLAWAQS